MKAKKDDLNKIVQDLTVKLYQQAQSEQSGAQPGADSTDGGQKDDNTVDGDFKEVDPDKKINQINQRTSCSLIFWKRNFNGR